MPRQARLDARAREGLAYLALEVCGYTGSAVADLLGVHPAVVYQAAQRGRTARGRWERSSNSARRKGILGSNVQYD